MKRALRTSPILLALLLAWEATPLFADADADAKSLAPSALLAELPLVPDSFVVDVVRGVETQGPDIDTLITTYAIDWTLDRMPVVDRSLLRMARLTSGEPSL